VDISGEDVIDNLEADRDQPEADRPPPAGSRPVLRDGAQHRLPLARVDRLEPGWRTVLTSSSVLGRTFGLDLIEARFVVDDLVKNSVG